MNSRVPVLPRESALMPQKADGLGVGALIALLVHLGLVLALAIGVSWHASEPEGVTAELWASVPQAAAPPAAEPPRPVRETPRPTPRVQDQPKPVVQRDADIALEKERDKQKKLRELQEQREKALKEKQEKAEKERQADKAEADKHRKQEEETARLAKLREENLQRLMGQVGGTGAPSSNGNAARDAGPSASYAGRIKGRIKPNIVFTDEIAGLPGNPVAEVELRVATDGTILGRNIIKSSGVKVWDDTVLRAIDRTEVLPRDVDGRVPSSMVIAFRPKD